MFAECLFVVRVGKKVPKTKNSEKTRLFVMVEIDHFHQLLPNVYGQLNAGNKRNWAQGTLRRHRLVVWNSFYGIYGMHRKIITLRFADVQITEGKLMSQQQQFNTVYLLHSLRDTCPDYAYNWPGSPNCHIDEEPHDGAPSTITMYKKCHRLNRHLCAILIIPWHIYWRARTGSALCYYLQDPSDVNASFSQNDLRC